MQSVRLAGAGSFVPRRVITNEKITQAIPGWTAERIAERTGIEERRFLWDFDVHTGRALEPPEDSTYWPRGNTDMCEAALRRALEVAGLPASDLDAIYIITTTPDRKSFCHDAVELHHRLGCRSDTAALVVDSGCGGALYCIDWVQKTIRSGSARTVAVVASNFPSAYVDRDVWTSEMPGHRGINAFLSMYMFGDGAGAVVLRGDSAPGIIASTSGTDHAELVVHRAGGAQLGGLRAQVADQAYYVNGRQVAVAYPTFMQRAVDELLAPRRELVPQIQRYYLHQANRFVLERFMDQAGIPADRTPINVTRYGNTSAASTLILFSEDLEAGKVKLGSGEIVLFAAVGAGVHYGGQLVRL